MSSLRQPTHGVLTARVGQIVALCNYDHRIIEIGLVYHRGDESFEVRPLPRAWMFGWRQPRTKQPPRRGRTRAPSRHAL